MGFNKESPNKYRAIRTIQQPGTQYMINGQVYQQPGARFDINFVCELAGSGSVISEDGSEEPFELISFEMELEDDKKSLSVGIYYNEPMEFDKYIKQLFGI